MSGYQIVSDGSCDLGKERTDALQVAVVPYYISFEEGKFYKEIEEMDVRWFYNHMVEYPKIFPRTSLPGVADYAKVFAESAKEGRDIICLCLSAKFSGSYNSAMNARSVIHEHYPNVRIAVIDTTLATALQGLLVMEAARMRDDGVCFETAVEHIERIKKTGRIFFSVGSMDYLIHGGRVGKVKGLAASKLGIKPMISLRDGEIFPEGVTRSRKKAFTRIIDQARAYFEETGENPDDYQLATGYGYDYEECVQFRDQLVASMRTYSHVQNIDIYQIGATIGVHTGPYPLGMGFLKCYDR